MTNHDKLGPPGGAPAGPPGGLPEGGGLLAVCREPPGGPPRASWGAYWVPPGVRLGPRASWASRLFGEGEGGKIDKIGKIGKIGKMDKMSLS